uniref:Uncharacterized protein n=1 Tax=Ditylenchus dipsaci TaxID=166011 RepID=A0A915E493_9BILA
MKITTAKILPPWYKHQGVRVSVSVCVNTITQRVVPERLCADQPRPRPQLRKCPHIVCPAKWLAGSWTDCSVSCGSGEQHRDVFCVETYTLEQTPLFNATNRTANTTKHTVENRKVADQYCWQQQKPITERSCGAHCPDWQVGDWSECSVSCNKGIRRRNVECMQGNERTEDFLCDTAKKPIQNQPCYTGLSCNVFKDSVNDQKRPLGSSTLDRFRPNQVIFGVPLPTFGSAFSPNGYQSSNEAGLTDSSMQYQQQSSADESVLDNSNRLQDISFSGSQEDEEGYGKPRFQPSKWSECSTSCGPGIRSRTVECVAYQGVTADIIKLPDYECDGQTKPTLFSHVIVLIVICRRHPISFILSDLIFPPIQEHDRQ